MEPGASMTIFTSIREIALRYFECGWHPLELPAGTKHPPPEGRTGYGGVDMTGTEIIRAAWAGNIGLRMPTDVLGLDVDVYKDGDKTLKALLAKCGPLPNTWISHSGRNDGSGIRYYRVPAAMVWVHGLPGIEIIQRTHRYAAVYPSMHPDGRKYGWWDQAEGDATEEIPLVEDLPELPWPWIGELSRAVANDARSHAVDRASMVAFMATHTEAEAPGYVATIVKHFEDRWRAGYSRHDTMQHCLTWSFECVAAGLAAADVTGRALAEVWVQAMADEPRRAEIASERRTTEFEAMVRHAVGKVEAKSPEEIAKIHDEVVGPRFNVPAGSGSTAPVGRNLPPDFWRRPELAAIRAWAHARGRSADAVYGAIRARLCALVPHTLAVDTGIAVPISLNSLVAVIGKAGAGKSTSAGLARMAVPFIRTDIYEGPLGSGEGAVEVFFEWTEEPSPTGKGTVKVKVRTKAGALLLLDEGEALTRMAVRSGTTILPTIRSAYSGELLGQTNANRETHRILAAGSYRFVLFVGLQEGPAAQLLADGATGTPQRFVMFNANDPEIPDDPAPAPQPWPQGPWTPPIVLMGQSVTLAPEVLSEVRTRALAVQRGTLTLHELDAHRDQNRIKEAAMLAIMGRRLNVTAEDWSLAGMVLDTSDAVRAWVADREMAASQRAAAQHTQATVTRQRAVAQAVATDAHQRAVVSGATTMAKRAFRLAPASLSLRELTRATASRDRAEASPEEMVAHAVSLDWLRPVPDGWVAGGSQPASESVGRSDKPPDETPAEAT